MNSSLYNIRMSMNFYQKSGQLWRTLRGSWKRTIQVVEQNIIFRGSCKSDTAQRKVSLAKLTFPSGLLINTRKTYDKHFHHTEHFRVRAMRITRRAYFLYWPLTVYFRPCSAWIALWSLLRWWDLFKFGQFRTNSIWFTPKITLVLNLRSSDFFKFCKLWLPFSQMIQSPLPFISA